MRRLGRPFVVAGLVGLCFAVACGDDTTPNGGGGTGGEGATGGTPSTGGTPVEGGGGAGGEGGSGGAPALPVGASCTSDTDCAGGLCLTESTFGWAAGYCSALCDDALAPCEEGVCLSATDQASVCIKECDTAADCPGVANDCVDISGDPKAPLTVCLGGCNEDSQCETACDNDNLVCVGSAEVCDNGDDDDGDGLHDCAEVDCATETACATGIENACTGSTVLANGVEVHGTTSDGTDLFAAVCPGLFGAFVTGSGHENVYTFTAPSKGVLTITATSVDADVGLYLRTDCADGSTQIDCQDAATEPGGAEVSTLAVNAGDAVTIFVDAYDSTTEGDYTIVADFEAEVCGDGNIVGAEECDDNNTTSGDGCSATCTIEPAAFCASPAVGTVTLVPVNGDNSNGTAGFEGTCGGSGTELVYRYTPIVSGTATITAAAGSADWDGVLYVRTACADDSATAQLACADAGFGGGDESVDVPVTGGTPIWIFVDSYVSSTAGPFTLTVE